MSTMTLEIVANRIAELEKQMAGVLVKIEQGDKAHVKTKKEKKEKSPKKKRGLTGYLLFSKEN